MLERKIRLTIVLFGFGIKASLGQGYRSNFKVFGLKVLNFVGTTIGT
jgi:hypothetical protein